MSTTRSSKARVARLSKAPPEDAPAPRRAPSGSNLERDVITAMRRYNTRARALEDAATERDRVIRDALEGGVARARLVELTGLSAPRIDQIRRGARI